MAPVNGLQHLGSSVTAVWTTHFASVLPPGRPHASKLREQSGSSQFCVGGEIVNWLELQRKLTKWEVMAGQIQGFDSGSLE